MATAPIAVARGSIGMRGRLYIPQRYCLLPDGKTVVSLAKADGENVYVVFVLKATTAHPKTFRMKNIAEMVFLETVDELAAPAKTQLSSELKQLKTRWRLSPTLKPPCH